MKKNRAGKWVGSEGQEGAPIFEGLIGTDNFEMTFEQTWVQLESDPCQILGKNIPAEGTAVTKTLMRERMWWSWEAAWLPVKFSEGHNEKDRIVNGSTVVSDYNSYC